jgi:hypothetical protein
MSKLYSAENVAGIEVKSDSQDTGARAFADKSRQILLSEHLVVLCGLGVSLCITKDGQRVAPTMADLWSEAKTLAGDNFEALKKAVHYTTPDGQADDVELLLTQCQLSQRFQAQDMVSNFITDMEKRIVTRCGFITEHTELPHHELFFRKVARRSARMPRMQLFTTNYDLTFEKAAGRGGFILVDGFSHTQPQEFDGGYFAYDIVRRDRGGDSPEYIPNVFHLYKLHGSLDWERRGPGVFRAENPARPLIIYPRDSKFQSSYDQPYLELMSRFHVALRQQNTFLLVVGFGFNDQHIAEPLLSAIRSNVSLRVFVVDPHVADMTNCARELRALVASGDARVTLSDAKFEEFVALLPDVVTMSEQEMHDRRVREIASQS